MPERPELYVLEDQLSKVLINQSITDVTVYQDKSLNRSESEFKSLIQDKEIKDVTSIGKWLKLTLQNDDYIAINLGMGGEIYYNLSHDKPNTVIHFASSDTLTISFWWFGHVDYVKHSEHHVIDELGLDLMKDDITKKQFIDYMNTKRGAIKYILLDQRKIAGIGNYYIHDILFLSKIHPLTKANTLSKKQLTILYQNIVDTFNEAITAHGSDYEQDIYGVKGNYSVAEVAYKEGEPCPVCQTSIKKIKTGSTSSYICPHCQH